MDIFHSYVSLPEGTTWWLLPLIKTLIQYWYVMVILQMGEEVLIHFKLGRTNPRTK